MLLNYDFFRNALIAVVLLSIASAIIGTYIVSRRLVSISGGVTHACFGGLGLGYYLGVSPIAMAALFAIASYSSPPDMYPNSTPSCSATSSPSAGPTFGRSSYSRAYSYYSWH